MAGAQSAWADVIVGQAFYEQNYEATGIVPDWTTSVGGRFTPTILTEGDNDYLGVVNGTRNNNGCVLKSMSLNDKVAAGTDFVMTFDLKVSSSNNQTPTKFEIKDAANTGTIFSLTATGTRATTWTLNGGTSYELPNTNKSDGGQTISDVPWYSVKIKRIGTNTYVTITPKAGGGAIVNNALVSASATGGLGDMEFVTKRYNANFAIDNIRVTSPFSYSSDEVSIDITKVGNDNRPDMRSYMPELINEVGATGFSYSSSDWSIARIESGAVYLTGVGTASIGISGTYGGNTYKANYELTVYGSPASASQSVTTYAGNTTASWELTGGGVVASPVEVGVVTMDFLFGTECAVSVPDNSFNNVGYVLKVIDANGYSHPNVSDGTLHETSLGGTFYKFTLPKAGTLKAIVSNTPILLNAITTSSTVAKTSSAGNEYTWENLPAGTYYLYGDATRLHKFTFTYDDPTLAWSSNVATVNIMDVGISNPNMIAGLPTISFGTVNTSKNDGGYTKGYKSSDTGVATFYTYDSEPGKLHILDKGTTTITAIDSYGYEASYTLNVLGDIATPNYNGSNTLSFDDEGIIGKGEHSQEFSTGLTVTYGYTNENSIVTTYNDMTVLKIIDISGFSHPNLQYGQVGGKIPATGDAGGTYVKLNATSDGYLIVKGNVSSGMTRIYRYGTTTGTPEELHPEFDEENHTMSVSLATNLPGDNYYLYNLQPDPDDGTYIPPVHSISYVPGFFSHAYETVAYDAIDTYTLQEAKGFVDPVYSIVEKKGDVGASVAISGNKLINVNGGGAIRIRAEKGGETIEYTLIVAYPATPYPGKIWDFNDGSSIHSIITAVPNPPTDNGDWRARYKNASRERDARWFYKKDMAGDNASVIAKTAGLIFEAYANGFYMRNDENLWRHVGLFRRGASFTIPLLKAGDVVELNWKRDADNSGANFTATNVTDLRGKTVSEPFVITGSRNHDIRDLGGWTSFIVASDGDVKFTLEDNGYVDILSIRIYSGGYQPTMRAINQYDGGSGVPAPVSILLDEAEQSVMLNYSNPLRGTATGPAMYVLKGYRHGVDNIESVTGMDAQKPGNAHVDEDGYPVSDNEKAELYAQRQNLIGMQMYNYSWESTNNTYNNGVISATGGYGKVTVRLNNYTNDMKYVIGYTPDYTITFGSAPHQTYPYTWNFTNISGGAVHDNDDNAYNSVSEDYNTWANLGNYRFGLYTDTENGSFYVPGATLVTKNDKLNHDEFDGLGFTGELYFQTADGTADIDPVIDGSGEYNLLEYTLTTDNVSADADGTGENEGYWTAGNGFVKFGNTDKRELSGVAASGAAYKMDGGGTKNILIKPKRPFRNGDVITFKGYYEADAASTGSNYGMSFRNAADQSIPYLSAVFIPAEAAKNTEVELTYTVTRGDGIAGLSEVYVFRASTTTFLSYVKVSTKDHSAGVNYGKCITTSSSEPLVVTIPDLNAGSNQDWIYIKSSAKPSEVTNATEAEAGDGQDAASGVYKYKVTEAGNCEVTFPANTTIERIGVTHILKPLTVVGEKAWATESRDRSSIDYSLTGVFTLNNVDAKYATVSYGVQKATVTLNNIGNYGVPASTGLVLKMEDRSNLTSANSGGVPLFAPAISTATLVSGNIGFNGSMGNMMRPNVESKIFATERETVEGVDYTRFILATRFMRWKKIDSEVTHDATFSEGTVPVFYRMHLYSTTIDGAGGGTATTLNTLGDNKAYLSLRTANIPDALWKDQDSPVKRFIAIEGVSDMEEIIDVTEEIIKNDDIYSLSGIYMGKDESVLAPGIYIRGGKKFVVR